MIRKSEYFEQIDKFLDAEFSQPELSDFEIQLESDSDLADELNFHLDVQQALEEKDIINLRNNLNTIIQITSDTEVTSVFNSFNFGLSEELSSFQNLNRSAYSEDMLNFEHSFPKIHLYQHNIAGKENIHQFYKEQFDTDSANEEESFSSYEEELFTDIQSALEENDIFDLRANLKQVAQSIPAHQYSVEEIDSYVYKSMDPETRAQFEEILAVNSSLAGDVQLVSDLDLAVAENDIMDLRASLREIQKSEFQVMAGIEKIEGYIYNELSETELASFENEVVSNQELIKEIELIKNIDLALAEADVMQLRSSLQEIAGQIASEKQTEQSFAGRFKAKKFIFSSVAATLVLLLGISSLLSRQTSQNDLYQKFYNKYQTTGIARSEIREPNQALAEALQKYENQDYQAAIDLFREVIAMDQKNMAGHFYTGVSLQETGEYKNAISEYETVIKDNDNLFNEQAQWYIGLCYLQTSENRKAYKQFKKIAKNEGYYQNKAQEILRKIKYTEN